MFEHLDSLSASSGKAAPRLEEMEDRTTPAVVGTATPGFGTAGVGTAGIVNTGFNNGFNTGFNTTALNGLSLSNATAIDRAFVAEAGRLSLMQTFLGTLAANQATDPQVRSFGSQLAANQFALFQQVSPLVTQAGLNVQLTAIDRAVISALPTLTGSALNSQVAAFSSFYGLQQAGLAQFGTSFGGTGIQSFSQSQFSPLLGQLQGGFGLVSPTLGATTLNMFGTMGGFGPLSVTGLGTTGFNTNGAFNGTLNTGFGGFGTTGFNNGGFGAVNNGSGFGAGSTFVGNSTGFGPAGSTGFASNSGFGPANTTGGFGAVNNGTGFTAGTTATVPLTGTNGTSGTGSPIF